MKYLLNVFSKNINLKINFQGKKILNTDFSAIIIAEIWTKSEDMPSLSQEAVALCDFKKKILKVNGMM